MVQKLSVLILFCVLFSSAVAEECRLPSFEEEWKKSGYVFTGKIKKIEVNVYRRIADVQVLRTWKGDIASQLSVVSRIEAGGCAYPLKEGKIFLIFSSADDPALLDCCSRTRVVDEASEDIALLEEMISQRKSSGTRDPFLELKGDQMIPQQAPVPKELSIFYAVVVGIMKKGDEYLALLRDANGKVHTKKAGDRVYDGKVLKVGANSVTFVYARGNKVVTKKLHPFSD